MVRGKYPAIDTHCHIYPEKIVKKAVDTTADFYNIEPRYEGTGDVLAKEGRAAEVDHFVVCSVATKTDQVNNINNFILGQVESHKGMFTGLGTLHPEQDNVTECIADLKKRGMHGIKLHPDIQGFKADDPRMMYLYEECGKAGLPVLLHCGDSRLDYSNPNRVREVVTSVPGTLFVCAHMGGYTVWEEASEKLAGIENVYVDCSSTNFHVGCEYTKKYIKIFGPDRVMFGTDYPMWDIPQEVRQMVYMRFTEEEYRDILYRNACKVYNIDEEALLKSIGE